MNFESTAYSKYRISRYPTIAQRKLKSIWIIHTHNEIKDSSTKFDLAITGKKSSYITGLYKIQLVL
jgi:hypothetical protein